MSTPKFIRHNGTMYRLAAEPAAAPATDVVQETAGNPVENATAAPVQSDAAEGDRKTLEMLNANVTTKAKAIADSLATFMTALTDRNKADQVLDEAKNNLDGLIEDFKLLSGKYSGYAKRNLTEKNES